MWIVAIITGMMVLCAAAAGQTPVKMELWEVNTRREAKASPAVARGDQKEAFKPNPYRSLSGLLRERRRFSNYYASAHLHG
jgi:hypothetical protein